MLLNTNFEFYQGATLGGDYDLRGFRNERFFRQSIILSKQRYSLEYRKNKKKRFAYDVRILGGVDYGRV
jgi:hypothetical protein